MTIFLADALDISQSTIVVNGTEYGAITGVTLDGKTPEDIIKVLGGSVRRRKDEEYEWSADHVSLYGNMKELKALTDGTKFNIEISFRNPDRTDTTNLGERLVMRDCTVNSHNASFGESSTYKMSGTFSGWTVEDYTD